MLWLHSRGCPLNNNKNGNSQFAILLNAFYGCKTSNLRALLSSSCLSLAGLNVINKHWLVLVAPVQILAQLSF